jgi:hypothetical protein
VFDLRRAQSVLTFVPTLLEYSVFYFELAKRKMNQVSITDKFDYIGGGKKKGLGGQPGRAKSGKGKTGRPHRTNRNR